jgi:hypothetical protein
MHSLLARSLVLAAIIPAAAYAQLTLATLPTDPYNYLTVDNRTVGTSAYGQIFQTPDSVHTQIERFEFRLGQCSLANGDFAADLVQWNGETGALSGAPLWSSALQTAVSLAPYPALEIVGFDTGGIDLLPGQTYALVLFDPVITASYSETHLGRATSAYDGGGMVTFTKPTSSGSFSDLYTATTFVSANDLAFGATFSAPGLTAVPEPASAITGLGLAFVAGLVALRLHRQRRSVAPPAAPHA